MVNGTLMTVPLRCTTPSMELEFSCNQTSPNLYPLHFVSNDLVFQSFWRPGIVESKKVHFSNNILQQKKKKMHILAYNFHSLNPNSLLTLNQPHSPRFSLHHVGISISKANKKTQRRISRMAAAKATSTPIAATSVVQQQKVTISNKYGEKLVGLLHDTGSTEIVILCHGFCSRKENNTMVNLAVSLGNEGISAFRFDFAGNGESDGSFEYGNYYREADDLHAVIQHFHGANRAISAILGHSKGGNVVLLYASKYHDIQTVVNVSGRYDLKKGIEERLGEEFMQRIKKDGFVDVKYKTGEVNYRVTEESLMDRLNTDMHKACLMIEKECRVLTVHGSADEIIPVEDALEFAKIIPNHKLQIVEGADHGYNSHQPELASAVLNFIKECIHQDKNASS